MYFYYKPIINTCLNFFLSLIIFGLLYSFLFCLCYYNVWNIVLFIIFQPFSFCRYLINISQLACSRKIIFILIIRTKSLSFLHFNSFSHLLFPRLWTDFNVHFQAYTQRSISCWWHDFLCLTHKDEAWEYQGFKLLSWNLQIIVVILIFLSFFFFFCTRAYTHTHGLP